MVTNEASLLSLIDDAEPSKEKSPTALRTISEASEVLDVPQHVLRFWETKFTQIKPLKRNGGRRFYRPQDLDVLQQIKHLLYAQGYTIKGAQKAIADYVAGRSPLKEVVVAPISPAFPPAHGNDNSPDFSNEAEPDLLAELAHALTAPEEDLVIATSSTVQPTVDVVSLLRLRNEIADIRDALALRLAA